MSWFDRLERKMGKYAISNLMYYVIAVYALGFVITVFFPGIYETYLALDAQAILHGQIWRIFTFILQPPSTSFLFLFFVLYFYYIIGVVLERLWGSFRFNLYFFSGMFLHVIAALLIYAIFGVNYHLGTSYINLALFMAFAFENPDNEVLLFFVLPIKIKWLAYLDAVIFAITIVGGYAVTLLPRNVWFGLYQLGMLPGNEFACYVTATAALVSMANFFVFMVLFNKHRRHASQTQKNFRKAVKTAKRAEKNRQNGKKPSFNEKFYNANSSKSNWESANKPYHKLTPSATKHKCAVCGRTEKDGDELVFRFCSKCNGNLEYCQDHLYTHIHVTK